MKHLAAVGLGAIATIGLCSVGWGQGAKKPQAAPPYVFHASTRLVQINVVVDGRSGPVAGLQTSDFRVTDNGRPRVITVFSAEGVRVATATPAGAASALAGKQETDFSNATPRAAEMVVVLFDALNGPDGTQFAAGKPAYASHGSFAAAKRGALKFLATLNPHANVALYALDSQLRVLSDFTNDREQLLAALQAYNPVTAVAADLGNRRTDLPGAHGNFNGDNATAQADYARAATRLSTAGTVPALQAISNHLAGIPGRINLVWMMTRPPLPGAMVEAALARDNVAVYPMDMRGLMSWNLGLNDSNPRLGFSDIMRTAPAGLTTFEDIAEQTGGRAFINTNDFGGAIGAALADSAASYTLGFYVDGATLDDHFHALKVKVHGHGMQVRYPHGYWALKDERAGPPRGAAALVAALRNPLEDGSLPLEAHVVHSGADAPQDWKVRASVDIHNLRWATVGGRREAAFLMETVTQDAAGAALQSVRGTIRLNWSEAEYQRRLRSGFEVEQSVVPTDAAVTLRLMAADANSPAVGSLIIPLVAH